MELLWMIIGLLVQGLVVGALGRLAVPGPNPMSTGTTILVGIVGSVIGGLVGYYLFGQNPGGLLLGILTAALIVWLLQRGRRPV
ncbi:MAG: GlsB/YeaQ/YmgE family stress response membrane protein [Actinomycetota bacterium]|nr:GlsB/YeaQ/YmgE family stress response membrane protein [Actinomycetota bacterium]